ncbi:MAG: deoxyribodipyrimidine photo-lyase, partial [Phycisphaerales bacterium]
MHLHWFRSDLRTRDNTALHGAAEAARTAGAALGGLYVVSPGDWRRHDTAAVRVDFVLRTLAVLRADLAALNIPLFVRTAAAPSAVPGVVLECARSAGAGHVHWNIEYEVNEVARDSAVRAVLTGAGIGVHESHDQCIIEPGAVLTQAGRPFTVFTPFKNAWMREFAARSPELRSTRLLPAPARQEGGTLRGEDVPTEVAGFRSTVAAEVWPAGERAGLARLGRFVEGRMSQYKAERDRPDLESTSCLSPYLAAGMVSARQCLLAAVKANEGRVEGGGAGPACWISELIW